MIKMTGTALKADTVLLECEEGQRLLKEADSYQEILMELFDYQQHFSHCGMQSCALVLAAFKCGQACHTTRSETCAAIRERYHGFALFAFQETREIITHDVIKTRGMTLEGVGQLLKNHRHKVEVRFAADSSVSDFRQMARDALCHKDSSYGVIVNFQRHVLGQIEEYNQYGHHSPLCAYHETTDMFLLLDTNMGKPKVWLKTDDLFKAMLDIDKATNRSRGFIIMGGTQ